MHKSKWAASVMAFLLSVTVSSAEEWVKESFEGESLTTEQKQGDQKKVQWLITEEGKLNVTDDSKGLASGKALQGKKIMGVIPAILLSNPGDTVTVQFDFRLVAPLQDGKGYSPRFGMYFIESVAEDPWLVGNGSGYYAGLTAGSAAAGVEVGKESGGSGKILQGLDNTVLATGTSEFWINDTRKHTAVMVISMLDSGLNIAVKLDGTSMAQASDLFATGDLVLNRFALLSKPNTVLFDNFKVDVKMGGSSTMPQ